MNLEFNRRLGDGYVSKSQIARVLTEDWFERNMFCPICGNTPLFHYSNNKPVADFYCEKCKNDFELKSKKKQKGDLGKIINDGQYDRMIERITSKQNPNFLFLHYADYKVRNLILIPNHYFVPEIVIKRKPLPPTAKRAGWTGCNINISEIPQSGKIFIVKEGEEINRKYIQQQYQKTLFLKKGDIQGRGWILDILSCVERIPLREFTIDQVYSFATELQIKHPDNNNVHAKIRQQLQYLRDQGYIEFTSRGHYRKI